MNLAKKRKKSFSVSTLIMFIVLCIYTIILLGLMYWALESSFKENRDFRNNPIGLPEEFYNNYKGVFDLFTTRVQYEDGTQSDVGFWNMVLNSIAYAVGCAFFETFVTYIVAYLCARYKYRFSKIVYVLVLAYMVTPVVGTLPSQIAIARSLGIFGKMYGIWIMNATFLGMYFLVFYEIFKSLPNAYFEAARIDGANDMHLLTKIAMPITLTSFATVFLINFIKYWNDYQTPLIFVKTRPTLAYGMFLFTQTRPKIPELMSAAVVVLIPVIILFIATNKKLMGNITVGGIKG